MKHKKALIIGAVVIIVSTFAICLFLFLPHAEVNRRPQPPGQLIASYHAPTQGNHVDIYQDQNVVYVDIYTERKGHRPFQHYFECSKPLTSENIHVTWMVDFTTKADENSPNANGVTVDIWDGNAYASNELYYIYYYYSYDYER